MAKEEEAAEKNNVGACVIFFVYVGAAGCSYRLCGGDCFDTSLYSLSYEQKFETRSKSKVSFYRSIKYHPPPAPALPLQLF